MATEARPPGALGPVRGLSGSAHHEEPQLSRPVQPGAALVGRCGTPGCVVLLAGFARLLAMATSPSALDQLLPTNKSKKPAGEQAQLSVRVPVVLRDRAHQAAGRAGVTVAQLTARALEAEIARVMDPAAGFAADLAGNLQRRLRAALDGGTWDEAVAELVEDDPDLAS